MPFCGTATVIKARRYRSPSTGRTFSLSSAWRLPDCVLEETGWTISWSGDGTTGICKPPFATEAEAQVWADRWNGGER